MSVFLHFYNINFDPTDFERAINIKHKKRDTVYGTSTENSLQELETSRQIIDTAIMAHRKSLNDKQVDKTSTITV